MAESVVFVKVVRPALLSMLAFHVGIRAAILSISGCSSARDGLRRVKGIPRYVQGNGTRRPGKVPKMVATSTSVHRIAEMEHLSVFVTNPEASAKRLRMALRHLRSAASGDKKMTKSSA
jgi:hypothetical protein